MPHSQGKKVSQSRGGECRRSGFDPWASVEDGVGNCRPYFLQDPAVPAAPAAAPAPAAPPAPAADEKMLPQSQVTALIAREVGKAERAAAEKLAGLEKQAAENADLKARVAQFEEAGLTAAQKTEKALEKARADAAARESELTRTIGELKTRADADAIRAALAPLISARVPKENCPEIVERELMRHCVRTESGKVVWKDPETDEMVPLDKARDAWLATHRVFLTAPSSGAGSTPGTPGVRKSLSQMTQAELAEAANAELTGGR